ncbi:Helix-hairpin-helix motif-containing protein [Candidatus Thermokryptus mobilis]|uniref:Helix-hairpin-helix motif-containing protein n=1 Tax=Candidatus Thermokryptus mobilis TaxID=1643428 RepID=A0A0S4N9L5_9BACT|nr:helix-hairpin-helix domain-containing protein [Candidatus Thermokryptus mobilis]CUU06557.1 Helix-hairpin-helix motif-containing protein [Candidatus Thermokryptus mobilis]
MKWAVLILILNTAFLFSQEAKIDTLEDVGEGLFENVEEDSQLDEIIEQIEFIRIELNRAEVDDLTEIPFISREDALKIVEYRDKIGGFKRKEQVFDIPGIDERVKFLLYRNSHIQRERFGVRLRGRVVNKGGFRNVKGNFINDFKTYQLGFLAYSNFSSGFVIEKDYGERRIDELVNFYFDYKGGRILRRFIVGNYILQFGQGILFWRPVGLGKGTDAISPVQRSVENYAERYISTDEVKPFLGAVAVTKFKNFDLTVFYSSRKIPASLDSTGLVRYIDFSGINKGQRDILKRDVYGFFGVYGRRNFVTGVSFAYQKFDKDFSSSISRPYGGGGIYSSFMWDFLFKRLNFFGEFATLSGLYFSAVSGVAFDFENLKLAFQYRNLNPNFTSINGNTFGERYGESWNEEGFYSSVKFKLSRFYIWGYYDIFTFPVTEIDDAKKGYDYRLELGIFVSRNMRAKILIREKSVSKGIKVYDEFERRILSEGNERRKNFRIEIENKFQSITFRSRIEVLKMSFTSEGTGFVIYQGVKVKVFNGLTFYARIAHFRSNSYSSRIYVYEDDLDGVVSLIPLYGQGLRWYFVLKYSYWKFLSIQLKYAESLFFENVKASAGLQVEIKI